ncbi:MAG TPA: hypothetical protein VJ742_11955 [Nitrososphaera sp.]|nr:hypothetical protein [Nitrososphaera sp.]
MTTTKKKVYKEKYYSLTEDEMQDLIARAKRGDSRAQTELLETFSNFLNKYVALLYYGKYDLDNYDIRRFIALFIKDPGVRFHLMRNKLNLPGVRHVNEALRGIQYMAQRYGDEEDVDQTVKMSFLHCVSIYNRKPDIPFSGFLYSYFFYVLKKQVDAFLIDQLGRKTFPLLDDGDMGGDEIDGEERPQGFTAPPTPAADELIHAEEIDEYWVVGDTAHGPFATLTVQERQLLKWRYVDGERSSDIAARITEHPNTCREHFNKIRKKIGDYMRKELGELA